MISLSKLLLFKRVVLGLRRDEELAGLLIGGRQIAIGIARGLICIMLGGFERWSAGRLFGAEKVGEFLAIYKGLRWSSQAWRRQLRHGGVIHVVDVEGRRGCCVLWGEESR